MPPHWRRGHSDFDDEGKLFEVQLETDVLAIKLK